jgi:hypothetical protein
MSASPLSALGANASVQDLARTMMSEFDANQDGQFGLDEFANFLDHLVDSLGGATAAAGTNAAETTAGTTSLLNLATAEADDTSDATGSTEFRDRMTGFDYSRFETATGSLKYDAANIMQGIDPASPGAMQRVYQQVSAMHPGEVSLDSDGNLTLDGTGEGYIGIRPLDRSEDWDNPPSGFVWQWMAYNSSTPGPNGETC